MIIHFILSGETLESISEEINLENPKYLKEFHNQHCAREDMIYDKLIPGKKLLIPGINTIREYNSRNDAPFKHPKLNPDIPFIPENFSTIYAVTNKETYESNLEKQDHSLSYTVSVRWIKSEDNHHIFHLFKNNFSEEPATMMADLASESIRSLNPLEVKTDRKGNIFRVGITQQTKDNFKKITERLQDHFPDQYAKIYIDEFEMAVLNEELFNIRMQEDVFIKNYFAAIRNPFTNGKSFLNQSVGEENIMINLQQKIQAPEYNEEMMIIQTTNEHKNDLSYLGNYTLYTGTGMLKEINIDYTISQYGVKNYSSFVIKELS